MKKPMTIACLLATGLPALPAFASDDIAFLKQQLEIIKADYETRIRALEEKIESHAQSLAKPDAPARKRTNDNLFNPKVTVTLDGQYASYSQDPQGYELPGFALGGEAGLVDEGFSLGHAEITLSNNIDDKFYGQFTLAIAEHEGEVETELEEAFFETLGLGHGLTVRGGRFFTSVGYINLQHAHAWDFLDAPLVYRSLFGKKYIDDGVRLSWIAPTDMFLEVGVDILSGDRFPAAGNHSGSGSQVGFVNLGGDFGVSHSWQAGISYFTADVEDRESGGHGHGHEEGELETPSFSGDSDTYGASLIYKWAPQGNYKNRNFKLQAEYFLRDEDGTLTMEGSDPLEASSFDGDQWGYYVQGVYQFMPQWRTSLRYDRLGSDNRGDDSDVLVEAGLIDDGNKPERYSAMLEWRPSEFSRMRLQYNRDHSYDRKDNQVYLQYTFSLGSHGAHTF